MKNPSVERVAETHFFILPVLEDYFENYIINPEVIKAVFPPELQHVRNQKEYWETTHNRSFFNMGTLIRLGSAVETGLRDYYMGKKGLANLIDLRADPEFKKGIFQRIQNWQSDGVVGLYRTQLSYDLTSNADLPLMQELMNHRHLFAHNSGLVDDEYIRNHQRITGIDISADVGRSGYPAQDVYWFRPLKKLPEFIEGSRRFFHNLPT